MQKEKEHKCISAEELVEKTKASIEKFGLHVIMVNSTGYNPSFAYSIGLWETCHQPEIICFGLPADLSHTIINDVADLVKKGEKLKSGKNYNNIFKSRKAEFINVASSNIPDYFGVALKYYKEEQFPVLQLVWTDRNDNFPWEETFEEEFIHAQPLLDRNADFKFREERRLCVFTTKDWIEHKKPITRVFHDSDGSWQFLTGDVLSDDIRIVALEEMVKQDKTLNELFDLDYSKEAERDYIGGKWRINDFLNEYGE